MYFVGNLGVDWEDAGDCGNNISGNSAWNYNMCSWSTGWCRTHWSCKRT